MNHEPEYLPLTKRAFEDLRESIAAKIVAGEHWILLPGIDGMQTVFDIERKFYSGGAAEDFETHVLPFNKVGIFGLVLAVKKRLSPEKLAGFLRTQSLDAHSRGVPLTSTDLSKHSVVILAERNEGEFLMKNFKAWVDQSVQAEAELRRSGGRWN